MDKINVKGVAIKAGVSRNGIMYSAEELEKFAKTLIGVSIQKDHSDSVDSSIGKVTEARFDKMSESVLYSGWIKDDGTGITEKVKDRRVQHVSIGALVGKLVKEEESSSVMIAQNIIGVELSTVIIPGVIGTSIQQSLTKHKEAKSEKEKLAIPAISENVMDITIEGKKVDEMMKEVETSPDGKDGHTHKAMYDEETGYGKTSVSGTPSHEHLVYQFQVVPAKYDDYVSSHPGQLPGKEGMGKPEEMKHDDMGMMGEEKVKSSLTENISQDEVRECKDTKTEVIETMAEENQNSEILESLKAKESELQKMTEELNKMKQEKRQKLVEQYKVLVSEKKVQEKDVTSVSEETLKLLVEQLQEVKVVEEKQMEVKTKGQVGESVKEDVQDDSLRIEKSDYGQGYALFAENYNESKHKRLQR